VRVFDPDPRLRWLFCMTHPDDEISICAWIRRLVSYGSEVHICWTHSNQIREAEARAVGLLLGVRSERLHFMHGTDGQIPEEMPILLPKFRALMVKVKPDRVCCGAFEQGHLDHDSTNYLVSQSFDGPILEIPFYHTYLTRFQRLNRFANPHGEEILHLDIEEQRLKTLIARQFPSQNIWSVLIWYELWQKARLKPMQLVQSERMRLQVPLNYRRPNLPPRLAAKVKRSPSWRRWKAALRLVSSSRDPVEYKKPLSAQRATS
jgi:LmbE family N-acetylglucosaminyl deacetylase